MEMVGTFRAWNNAVAREYAAPDRWLALNMPSVGDLQGSGDVGETGEVGRR
jgi:hypothetical protein